MNIDKETARKIWVDARSAFDKIPTRVDADFEKYWLEQKKQVKSCSMPDVVCSDFSDAQLEDKINYWIDHYTVNGESHNSDTPDWKIREIYWEKIVNRVIEDVNTEMTEDEIDLFCNRLANL